MNMNAPAPQASPPQPQSIDIAKYVGKYIALRDKIKDISDRHKEELRPYAEMKEKLDALLLGYLNQINSDNASVKDVGTVYKTVKKSATVADADAFRRFVIGSEAWSLADWKANAHAVEEFIEQNNAPPPGVNYATTMSVGVRRK